MLDDPKIAHDLIYDYNGFKIKGLETKQVGMWLCSWQSYRKNWTNFSHK